MDPIKPIPSRAVKVSLGDPVVVSMADPAERTWAYYQFPTISRMPGGEILLTYNNTQDDDLCYGHAGPAFVSYDDGQSWQVVDLDEKALTIAHSPVGEVFDGEFLCVPMPVGFSPSALPARLLKKPAARSKDYIWRCFYDLAKFPKGVNEYFRHLRGLRWTPATRQWQEERIAWDLRGALLRLDAAGMIGSAWSRTSLEYRPVRCGRELLDANYKLAYRHDDGTAPKGFEVWCMASQDNGRSWQRRGLIARDPSGKVPPTETALSMTTRGDLVCVVRTTHRLQLPMWLTFSDDQGRTWSKPKTLFDHGVLPNLQPLANSVLVLSFGRPGVHLSFSPDGSGRAWTQPVEVLPTGIPRGSKWTWEKILRADPGNVDLQKDGYTGLLPIGNNRFLIAYSDMAHVDAKGRKRKAVKVRAVTVDPR